MMSSEEESEFGLYTDKLLKKTKRTRQRVDAGEPRNSYSSIPNFSSRPAFLGGGNNLYGAIFTQQQQFGLFGPGFAPAKMLNDLLSRQKAESGVDGEDGKFDSSRDGSPPSGEQLAHHMLRDILQGRKHELLALEHDMRNGQDHIINNNNNEPKASPERNDVDAAAAMKECLAEAGVGDRQQAELMEEALNGMETESLPSPKVEPSSPAKPEDAKKARVENIVSGMRSSPAPPQVNGCKKRKLYQPQQHDSTADRYVDDDEEEIEPIRQKRVEKSMLKSQLRSMQEQLAEMQQKYMQLCTRVEQGSEESQEVEEIPSDSEQSKRSAPPSPITTSTPTPVQQQQERQQHQQQQHQQHQHQQHQQPNLVQEVSKMKISPPGPPFHNGFLHNPHQHMNSAAAMYLGVSHKLFLEQEARLAKEAAAAANNMSNESQQSQPPAQQQTPPKTDHISERLTIMRNMTPSGTDLEGLADALKSEITASLSNLIDSILQRFVHQKRCKQQDAATAAEQLNKDLLMASQLLDRKSPRTKVAERPQAPPPPHNQQNQMVNGNTGCPPMMPVHNLNNIHKPSDLHIRPPMFQPPKPPGISAPLYGHPFCVSKQETPEQNEALSLVVAPKKKRHKVTDTRITPRTVSRILGQDGMGMSPAQMEPNACTSPRPPPYHQPPPMLPVSLPTSVAIPNPGLHESQVFSPYSPFFHGPSHGHHMAMQASSSPPRMHKLERESPPDHHLPTLLHPALLAAAQHGGSPDYGPGHLRPPTGGMGSLDNGDRNSDCNSGDISYDGMQPTISFLYGKDFSSEIAKAQCQNVSLTSEHSSTLTPMHLRKAKLMFFWVRYPSSAVLKMYFPDIKFNKNNTAQLVKWFSNFREFYYIQMEKYARQAVSEGVKNADDLHVGGDSELYRVLNLHYNRNNHIEVPSNFRFVVEQTLREFFKAIQEGRDAEQSWKKSIYKIISRLDDPVPEYFKSPNFLEQLE